MKKIIAMMLCLTMVLALCACGQQESPNGTVISQNTGNQEPTEASEEAQEDLQLGSVVGTRYENASLGIGCELDENWAIASEEELAQMVGLTADMFQDENMKKQLESVDMFYDFFAQRLDGMGTINIVFQNLGLLYGAVLSEEQYAELTSNSLEEQLSSAGFTDISWERNTLSLAGAEREGLHIHAKIQGVDYYAQQVLVKTGRYMAVITLGSFVEDTAADLAENFFTLS